MDDDTSAVVFIAGVIIIAVIASYATYQWVVNNSQEAIKYGFYHSKPYPHAALFPTSSSELTRTPHLRLHNTVVMNVPFIIEQPKTYILSMGFDKQQKEN